MAIANDIIYALIIITLLSLYVAVHIVSQHIFTLCHCQWLPYCMAPNIKSLRLSLVSRNSRSACINAVNLLLRKNG